MYTLHVMSFKGCDSKCYQFLVFQTTSKLYAVSTYKSLIKM